jgi:hypothetical protein
MKSFLIIAIILVFILSNISAIKLVKARPESKAVPYKGTIIIKIFNDLIIPAQLSFLSIFCFYLFRTPKIYVYS